MKKTIFRIVLCLSFAISFSTFLVGDALGQDFVEVRAGVTRDGLTYRYLDYNHTFKNDVVVDIAHYGAPGQNELWVGAGKYKKFNEGFSATFAGYLVAGKENKQLGLGLSSWGSGGNKKVAVNYQVYGFIPAKGSVKKYLAVDTFDVTYKVNKKIEVGGSAGMFWTGSNGNFTAGPIAKINDKYGAFSFSVRAGAYTEFRIGRTSNFDFSKLK